MDLFCTHLDGGNLIRSDKLSVINFVLKGGKKGYYRNNFF